MIVILNDGTKITGKDHTEIVTQMNYLQFAPCDTLEEYMVQTIKRVKGFYGIDIKYINPRTFILALQEAGLLNLII